MVLLVLYYVYMWITVPWSYYEGARSRRISHYQHRGHEIDDAYDDENVRAARLSQRKRMVQEELRRHELLGLLWVIVSPAIAAYTLQYSRYVLTNHEKYMSSFNIKVFVIGASIKPLIHVMALLRERTLFLQSEMQVDETDLELLQKKMELLKDELDVLKKAMATKKDLGQVTQNITPSIQQLSKAFKNFEKKESQLKTWSEDRFTEVNKKFQDVDQFICYSVEQEQRRSIVATLMFLPIHIVFWTLKRASALLPIPNLLLNLTTTTTGSFMTPTMMSHKKRPIGQLTHTASVSAAATAAARATTAQGPLCSPQGIHPDLKRRSTSASHSTTMASFS
ncbi:hypothetical protein BDF20DRAFT_842831 [Mycotypha africana]|uniref:uncharacterized protein n=1 Tax=Mycotypha africana TaxID=64632 RepID=UPI002300B9E9|nr:uncharacterized protein BDF20DRAFT_842831 [Mycotypha africana]KAI8991129.1 hypothetical protein BDF20DRAFT_842831 [Mycotypha africana]